MKKFKLLFFLAALVGIFSAFTVKKENSSIYVKGVKLENGRYYVVDLNGTTGGYDPVIVDPGVEGEDFYCETKTDNELCYIQIDLSLHTVTWDSSEGLYYFTVVLTFVDGIYTPIP